MQLSQRSCCSYPACRDRPYQQHRTVRTQPGALGGARPDGFAALLKEPYNIAPTRLVAVGVGPIAPVASNKSDEGRALDRRVTFVLIE